MLRGVNKSVIEVLETENKYFERAILFVRTEFLDKDDGTLSQKAGEYIKNINPEKDKKIKLKYKKPESWVGMALSGALGAALTAAFFLLI